MAKWFSFNQQTQRTEEIVPSEELFNGSPLLFWTRGMNEWESGHKALEHFLRIPDSVVAPSVVISVVEEKKQTMGPFYSSQPVIVPKSSSVPVVARSITKTDPIKPLPKKLKIKVVKKLLKKTTKRKKISKHINLVVKKKKNKNRRKKRNK